MNHTSATKLMVQEWDLPCFRSDYSSPSNHYKSALSRKTNGTTNVTGGQTGTISRVEEQRSHNIEGNNIQVLSKPSDAEPTPTKMPPFFPPPPFPPPPYNVNSAPPLIPPPRVWVPVLSVCRTSSSSPDEYEAEGRKSPLA
ncbi:pre-mRNA 3'-end-processing factor FIP1-like isoform X2 [Oncorhynchus kisutch]|uniref:pre-mRNA 3'-end-processing factor FIP1-like isoform X2 n=1 Tax=Oncorhynchus kisutch TaxID=8019 RepID=UPI0012DD07DC|nr:pre-mRNA 3'-end-processing factor FIP1-like isoform X2 [Oncorhynchus kisutch]